LEQQVQASFVCKNQFRIACYVLVFLPIEK